MNIETQIKEAYYVVRLLNYACGKQFIWYLNTQKTSALKLESHSFYCLFVALRPFKVSPAGFRLPPQWRCQHPGNLAWNVGSDHTVCNSHPDWAPSWWDNEHVNHINTQKSMTNIDPKWISDLPDLNRVFKVCTSNSASVQSHPFHDMFNSERMGLI